MPQPPPAQPEIPAPVPAFKLPPERVRRALAWLVIAAAYMHAVAVSWRKWGDVFFDSGVEYELPRQLAAGKMLYRDVYYGFGPLPHYLNALLYSLFGVHGDVLMVAGLFVAASMCVLLYRIVRLFTHRLAAVCVTLSFIYLCAFAHLMHNPAFNFVIPYTFMATYGTLFAVSSLYFLLRYAMKGKSRDFVISAACLALTALCKLEIMFTAALVHALFIFCRVWMRQFSWRFHAACYAAAVALVVGVYAGFYFNGGTELFRFLRFLGKGSAASAFNQTIMGTDDLAASLWNARFSLLSLGGSAFSAWLLSRLAAGSGRNEVIRAVPVAAAFAIPFAIIHFSLPWFSFLLVPEILLAALIFRGAAWLRSPARRQALLPHLILLAFALSSLSRMLFRTWAPHYGFFMLPPALAALGVIGFSYFPARIGRLRDPAIAAGCAGFFLAVIVAHFDMSQKAYKVHTLELVSPRGTLFPLEAAVQSQDHGRNPLTRTALPYQQTIELLASLPRNTRAVVVPHGIGLLFFGAVESPYPLLTYFPMDFAGDGESRILEMWQKLPPDVIVRLNYDASEFGSRGFGIDYARRCVAWIDENYEVMAKYGGDYITVYKRKDFKK